MAGTAWVGYPDVATAWSSLSPMPWWLKSASIRLRGPSNTSWH